LLILDCAKEADFHNKSRFFRAWSGEDNAAGKPKSPKDQKRVNQEEETAHHGIRNNSPDPRGHLLSALSRRRV
jgi:hypothetical protein